MHVWKCFLNFFLMLLLALWRGRAVNRCHTLPRDLETVVALSSHPPRRHVTVSPGMVMLTAVSYSVFYYANQIMPCRYHWWLNVLIQLAKHCRLYFIKKKEKNYCQKAQRYARNSPPSPSRYFADVGTSLMWKQIRLSPRWTEQVEAEGGQCPHSSLCLYWVFRAA